MFVSGCQYFLLTHSLPILTTSFMLFSIFIAWWRHQMKKHFPRYWPFVREIHRSAVNSPHRGQWRGALMFSLICAWINGWVNNREAGHLRRYRAHYYITVMGMIAVERSRREIAKSVSRFLVAAPEIHTKTRPSLQINVAIYIIAQIDSPAHDGWWIYGSDNRLGSRPEAWFKACGRI